MLTLRSEMWLATNMRTMGIQGMIILICWYFLIKFGIEVWVFSDHFDSTTKGTYTFDWIRWEIAYEFFKIKGTRYGHDSGHLNSWFLAYKAKILLTINTMLFGKKCMSPNEISSALFNHLSVSSFHTGTCMYLFQWLAFFFVLFFFFFFPGAGGVCRLLR